MLSRDSEDAIWSRFVFELVIWPQKVTLVRWTQPSGPLCLWQCFSLKLVIYRLTMPISVHQRTKHEDIGYSRYVWYVEPTGSVSTPSLARQGKQPHSPSLTARPTSSPWYPSAQLNDATTQLILAKIFLWSSISRLTLGSATSSSVILLVSFLNFVFREKVSSKSILILFNKVILFDIAHPTEL